MSKAASTRLIILQKAFELIYAKGYQTTSIDDILATTKVTKGAFYYHFKNKDEMGVAIINELLKPGLTAGFIQPLQQHDDPLVAIYSLMYDVLLRNDFMRVEYGCSASNLTQEMAPWNAAFTKVLNELSQQWMQLIAAAIEQGKVKGYVRKDVNARQAAVFIMSGYWGIRNFGKLENNSKAYQPYLKELKNYLNSLR
ncbi:MAG TPA: TetR/AcrR family transcriptional regulator [Chitinophagales bacterium]|nr:TetR/AcrR family transcriptional regulator [Chitinophagales bacterium]